MIPDIGKAQFRFPAHQGIHQTINTAAIIRTLRVTPGEVDLQQPAACGRHGCFFKLSGRHLPQPLETADFYFAAAFEIFFKQLILMGIIEGIGNLTALGKPVERRLRQKQPAAFNQPRHLLIEIRHQQGRDMRAVNIGIGHDDDAAIAQPIEPEILAWLDPKREGQIRQFLILHQLVITG